jgi:hypothetical protein
MGGATDPDHRFAPITDIADSDSRRTVACGANPNTDSLHIFANSDPHSTAYDDSHGIENIADSDPHRRALGYFDPAGA